jgi:hypothetical protein
MDVHVRSESLKGTRQRFYSFLSLASEEINFKVITPKLMFHVKSSPSFLSSPDMLTW